LSKKLQSHLPDATPEGRNEIYFMYFPVLNKDGFGEAVKDRHNRRFGDDTKKAADDWASVESRIVAAASTGWASCVGKHWLGGDTVCIDTVFQVRAFTLVVLLGVVVAFSDAKPSVFDDPDVDDDEDIDEAGDVGPDTGQPIRLALDKAKALLKEATAAFNTRENKKKIKNLMKETEGGLSSAFWA
jgi:hypothetical protein